MQQVKARMRSQSGAVQLASELAEHILIVPIAADKESLLKKLASWRIRTKVRIARKMKMMLEETNESLRTGKVLWELPSLTSRARASAKKYFVNLENLVRTFFLTKHEDTRAEKENDWSSQK